MSNLTERVLPIGQIIDTIAVLAFVAIVAANAGSFNTLISGIGGTINKGIGTLKG